MEKVIGWTGRYVVPVLILVGAFYGARLLIASRPEAMRQQAQDRVVPVEIVHPVRTNHTVTVEAMGRVVPASRVEVRAQVGGRVTVLHDDFEVGGRIPADVVLANIERDDYEAALIEAESTYAQRVLAEALELQRQTIARDELEQEGVVLPDGPGRAIALREPQVEAARRSRAAAAAAVERARRDLDRTSIRVPFDAVVLRKMADAGSVLTPQAVIGEVAARDRFHVEAVIPHKALQWLPAVDAEGRFAGQPVTKVGVELGRSTVWRPGYLSRLIGDMRGNMVRILVVVEDPLDTSEAPVLLGSYVPLRIPGIELQNMWAIPRRAVREDGSVLLADADERLASLTLDIVRSTPEVALLREGLAVDDRVITTALSAAVPGMQLRVMSDTEDDNE